jgi:uncharacterized protein (TIGR02145 family)
MKIKIFLSSLYVIFLAFMIFNACESKPTKPDYNNVFDPGNPTTSGDPFELQVIIGNGGVMLNWSKSDIQNLNNFIIYRSEQEGIGYSEIGTAANNQTQYVDDSVQNGYSYWYRIAAINGNGNETGTTNISAININTNPVLVINSGDEYTPTKEINLTIIANTAQQMMLSNIRDFTGATWETYSTTKNWALLTGEGEKIVFMKIKYSDGIESAVITDSISPQPMTNSTISIAGGALYTSNRNVDLTFSITGSNLQMKVSEDSILSGLNWQIFSSTINFQLSMGEGLKIVYAKFKNDFDVESQLIKNTISLDMTPPVLIIAVTPDSGVTNETNFQFDPTDSYDNLFPSDSLKIRYDWENDGNWDTDWTGLSIKTNQYTIGGGAKTAKMQIKDGAGLDTNTTSHIFINTRPVASFTATQHLNIVSVFFLNASASSDYEDGHNLSYRWDFDGDGNFDTDWTSIDTVSHAFSDTGNISPVLSARDVYNLTSSISVQIYIPLTVTDIDGNIYNCIKIGNQWWMGKNLQVTHYQNGDPVPHVVDDSVWSNLTTGAYCSYDNNSSNIETYGHLYNWYAVNDNRNIAPQGWHIPSDEEWKELEMFLGMTRSQADTLMFRGTDEGGKLKETGISHWLSPNTGATNSTLFTGVPAGNRSALSGNFLDMNEALSMWSSTAYNTNEAWHRVLLYNSSKILRHNPWRGYGLSVRCVKD